ncbi:MAG: TAXI family TRAP transporter solute-binding subunit [Epsilonproteobacteria bacterium]|nr:TAXI family TRAP transporter solute-binding subunit [Campylobacterota bacterium]
MGKLSTLSKAALASMILGASAYAIEFITIGTGGVTGVYYPTGGAICRIMNKNKKETGIKCTVESTGGSVYNIKTIKAGELDFGIAQSDVVYQATHGEGKFKDKPYKDLRVVMSIHPELLTLAVRKDTGIKSFFDLKGKKINIGNPGSGQEATVKMLFENCGKLSLDDIKVEQLKAAECPNALKDKKIDGYFYMVGHPTANFKDAANSTEIDLISLKDVPAAQKLVEEKPYYAWGTIPAGMYKGVDHDTETYGVKAVLVTSKQMPEKTVYLLTKAILDNFDKFKKLHPAYKNLTKEDLLKGFDHNILHPGAAKAFKEAGILK